MKKALFIDFDDSFTFNLVQELVEIGFDVEVISWKNFESLPKDGLLVLGPGPGRPDEYQRIFPLVKMWLDLKRAFFGVCLGHQIFWQLQGREVVHSSLPLHGQKIKLRLTNDWRDWLGLRGEVFVQRYNSLVIKDVDENFGFIKNYVQDGEVLISRGENLITYQFHPESIGTKCRHEFMRPIFEDLV